MLCRSYERWATPASNAPAGPQTLPPGPYGLCLLWAVLYAGRSPPALSCDRVPRGVQHEGGENQEQRQPSTTAQPWAQPSDRAHTLQSPETLEASYQLQPDEDFPHHLGWHSKLIGDRVVCLCIAWVPPLLFLTVLQCFGRLLLIHVWSVATWLPTPASCAAHASLSVCDSVTYFSAISPFNGFMVYPQASNSS